MKIPYLALGPLADSRPDFLHRQDDGPPAMIGMLAQGRELQAQRLLVVGRDAGIETDSAGVLRGNKLTNPGPLGRERAAVHTIRPR